VVEGEKYFRIIRVEERRPAVYEEIEEEVRSYYVTHREAELLMAEAQIEYLPEPAAKALPGEPEAVKDERAEPETEKWLPKGLPEDLPEVRRRAGLGEPRAQYFYATYFERGVEVERDLAVAREWYAKAAAGGDERARIRLELLEAYRASDTPVAPAPEG
jgi:TPR repeat protein